MPRGSRTRGRTPLDSDAAGPQVTLKVVEDERDLLPSTMRQSTNTPPTSIYAHWTVQCSQSTRAANRSTCTHSTSASVTAAASAVS